MLRTTLLSFALLAACNGGDPKDTGKSPVDTGPAPVDADGDGVPEGADCDDSDEYVYPGAIEVPYDGEDQDCDGEDENDVDGDGFIGERGGGDDCNDANPDVYPGAEVICYDLIDEDCTEGWSQYDCDGDGFEVTQDCGDEDPEVYPGAPDTWYDGVDSDCDTRDDYDQDGDGFRTASVPDLSGNYGDDCDDLDATVNADAAEIWDGRDNDCDGGLDALTNRDASTSWYGDASVGETLFGWSFAPVGDLNGDGFVDVAVGVLGYGEFAGRVHVLPYGDGLETPATTALATIDGDSYLGTAVAGLQGPGGRLVAVGEAGTASVHLFAASDLTGGAALTSANAVATITSGSYYIGGTLGTWADAAGSEALLVSSFEVADAGMSVALYPAASLSGTVTEGAALWSWTASGDSYDAAVLTDLDGDGLAEIGMATSGFNGVPRAYVATGALVSEGGTGTATSSITGFDGHVLLAGAGDLDGDGYGEYVLSDWEADGAGDGAGKVWIVGGPQALAGGAAADIAMATVSGTTDDGALRAGQGTSDLDGDGVPDLIVCAPGDGASSIKGACSWVAGVALAAGGDHTPGTGGPTWGSVAYDDQYGSDVLPHDVDGDGDEDLFVSGIGDAGAMFLYLNQ